MKDDFNPLTPTAAIWVQLQSSLCQTQLSHHLQFLTSGHSDALTVSLQMSKISYKWRLNPV